MANKTQERALVETTRRLYPWFPPGELVDCERPDFLLLAGDDRIGIEVTELFQPARHRSKFGPHVARKFHKRVMEIAERRAHRLPPLDVLVYFDYRHDIRDAESCANTLIEFVGAHACGTYDQLDGIPHGLSVVRIAEPSANQVPRWSSSDSGTTLQATREMLAATIGEKNRSVPFYRSNVSRVWLLIACSFGNFANTFSLPRDADTWRFDYDFDKVLLLSSEQGVFNLLRQ